MPDCDRVAVIDGYVYRCRSHEGGVHHFAARWPACPAPFCRLEPGHRTLHDIPAGTALFATADLTPATCRADLIAFPLCKHPPKYRAVGHGQSEFDLCGRHAHWLRGRPAWQIRPLEELAAGQ